MDPPSTKVFEAVLVSVSMKGLKAQLSKPFRQKLPFTLPHLCKFYEVLVLSDVKQFSVLVRYVAGLFRLLPPFKPSADFQSEV